ncbi:response regulator [Lacimicrobium alkaliphilum]|uniref:Response regulator n=1 Tax=Lacimicrobium alkaliphilum TaxID=1526571 RepID=A0A0U2QJ77_9ALTE|nr:response regulator [Lacimicrobium alkaliphilum]ALS97067.1 hypothetical protein AT746_01410 [Lacimicrobium alkaliphilum]
MKVLILEDDELIAELLESLVSGLDANMHVVRAESLSQGMELWQQQAPDCLLCDWNLPDGSGLELVRRIRRQDTSTKVIMITARSDRESVVQAARCKVNGFITKPFDIEEVHQRLKILLCTTDEVGKAEVDIQLLLSKRADNLVQLPGEIDPVHLLTLIAQKDSLSPATLAREWREAPAITARLLDLANNYSLGRSGKAIQSLNEALATLGVDMALSHALAMSLDISSSFKHPHISELAKAYKDQAEKVAKTAESMGEKIGLRERPLYIAGLLSRIGELGVLKVLQDLAYTGEQLRDETITTLVQDWAKVFGNKLKIQWRLPLSIRELIGAVHVLPVGTTDKAAIVMHLAALNTEGKLATPQAQKLLRQAGFTRDSNILKEDAG